MALKTTNPPPVAGQKEPELAWDFPVLRKVEVPGCTDERIFHQNKTTYYAVKKYKNNLSVRRFENGVLKAKQTIWAGEVRLVTTDGYLVALDETYEGDNFSQRGNLAIPLAVTSLGLQRFVAPLLDLIPTDQTPGPVSRFLTTGDPGSFSMMISIFDPELKPVGKSAYIGNLCRGVDCWEQEIHFFQGVADEIHAVWIPGKIKYEGKATQVIRSFDKKTGKALGPARPLLKSDVYLTGPVGDRIRERLESAVLYDYLGYNLVRTQSTIYLNQKAIARVIFNVQDTMQIGPEVKCELGSIRLELSGPAGVSSTEIVDEDLKAVFSKSCSRKYPNPFVDGFQLEPRPGGGFFVLLFLSVVERRPGDGTFLGTFFREYDAAGKPLGPVRKVDLWGIQRISENAWRAQNGCSWEVRSREKTR